jgi:oxygen-independent coproporphyrinogen-3 oxidase
MTSAAAAIATATELASRVKPGPRYTSYPPATEFRGGFGPPEAAAQLAALRDADDDTPLSLYLHIPFCSQLCWYCACNVVVTKRRSRGAEYVDLLAKELALLADAVGTRRPLIEIALGGGSPNFLGVDELIRLIEIVGKTFTIDPEAIRGIELDPRDTHPAQLVALSGIGFRRLSVGVQDFDPAVQRAIHREQSADQTAKLVHDARELGFTEVNMDLVYGLPLQTTETIIETIDQVIALEPDQIALFGYAHVPNRKPHQKLLERAAPIPDPLQRATLVLAAHERLENDGYVHLGIDHFARPTAPLTQAAASGNLHRNFQGYVVKRAAAVIGCGSTAISESNGAYWQNHSDIDEWEKSVRAGQLPIARGVALDDDDQIRRYVIMSLMCEEELDFAKVDERFGITFEDYFGKELVRLNDAEFDDLLQIDRDARWLGATWRGRMLVRNVCKVFDRYSNPETDKRFSPTL